MLMICQDMAGKFVSKYGKMSNKCACLTDKLNNTVFTFSL